MDQLEYVIGKLESEHGRLGEVALQAGVPYSTVLKIKQRVTPNPRISTVQRLADYFRNTEVTA